MGIWGGRNHRSERACPQAPGALCDQPATPSAKCPPTLPPQPGVAAGALLGWFREEQSTKDTAER